MSSTRRLHDVTWRLVNASQDEVMRTVGGLLSVTVNELFCDQQTVEASAAEPEPESYQRHQTTVHGAASD